MFSVKLEKSPAVFWGTKYHLIRAHMDKGLYKDAQLIVDDVKNSVSQTFDDGKYGYKPLFDATIEELKQKLFK